MYRHSSGLVLTALALAATTACEGDTSTVTPTTFDVTVENVGASFDFPAAGGFSIPENADMAGPAGPGQAFEVRVPGTPGLRLSFATMFGQSNDLFYAPDENGIALYDGTGAPVSGDVTSQVHLWDAGTEVNQEPGLGPDQAPRQAAPNTGEADPVDMVRLAQDTYGNLPDVADVIRVTLTPNGDGTFMLRIEDVSTDSTLRTSDGGAHPAPVSPGAWVVHQDPGALFTPGMPASGALERLAEDGAGPDLSAALEQRSGVTTPLSPGVWAVYQTGSPVFMDGQTASPGLELLAETGSPADLAPALSGDPLVSATDVFDTPDGATAPGVLMPGHAFSFSVQAVPGDHLQLATMFGQSNDLFFGFGGSGLSLFSGDVPVSGDVSNSVTLWDAGTEVNQWPGLGPDQAPRQATADAGEAEGGAVHAVDDGFPYPATTDLVRVTISPRQ